MAFHAVPRAIGVTIAGICEDGQLRHVLHCQAAAATPTVAELEAAANAVAAWCAATYKNSLAAAVLIQSVTAKDESVVDGPQAISLSGLPVAGTIAVQALPASNTLCVSLRSNAGGRSYRGRFYTWPATTAQLAADSNFLHPWADGVATALGSLITSLSTAGVPLAIKSNAKTVVTPVFTAVLTDYLVDSQRRRLKGRGR